MRKVKSKKEIVPEDDSSSEVEIEELKDLQVTQEDINGSDDEREIALEMAALEEIKNEKQDVEVKKKIFEKGAIKELLKELNPEKLEWIERCSVTSSKPVEVADVDNDLEIETAIYNQALEAAVLGKKRILAAKVPFTRPSDYFAEMVKTDEHMDKIKSKLLNEHKAIVKAEEAKRQRELKKFGKKVQNEKIRERQEKKKETLDKIEAIKKKRKSNSSGGINDGDNDDEFSVAIADDKGGSSSKKRDRNEPNAKRQAKNQRYGFGGVKRGKKRNTADSTDDLSGFNAKKMKTSGGGKKQFKSKNSLSKRLGKSRRVNSRK
ncbi:rRNA-processing protein EBP2 [Zancudomyces culisetae]|uniref:rRNA-processing protein EBP2 n=1 Tax=Zancudomyces culisetae TaxID=1213189 RepID=A0A1R1PPN8_ZANCU|nr:rRNA-processing protein EBP2 [Zancudomyces culisetae]|eukprot:OMH82956.1 rRNA-processing protein EBP2 [Zancudomyces culisetae]